jgi:hypothetical protein
MRLGDWYDENVHIHYLVFVCGSAEEIALVDGLARVRIFSWITQQFR